MRGLRTPGRKPDALLARVLAEDGGSDAVHGDVEDGGTVWRRMQVESTLFDSKRCCGSVVVVVWRKARQSVPTRDYIACVP